MALELTTDGDAQTFTAGDAGYKYGNTNTSTVGAVYGFCTFMLGVYAGFVNVVTGVAIHIETPISISVFGGLRIVLQGGAVYTLGKMKELNQSAAVTKSITELETLITNQTQIIQDCTDDFNILTQTVASKFSNYNEEETTGETSTEEWAISKSITSASYSLNCEELASIIVAEQGMVVTPIGVCITGQLIELGD